MARAAVISVSNRLQPVVAALLCLMASQLVLASCGDPEPITYAARAAIVR